MFLLETRVKFYIREVSHRDQSMRRQEVFHNLYARRTVGLVMADRIDIGFTMSRENEYESNSLS
jgi:hypothetical protein